MRKRHVESEREDGCTGDVHESHRDWIVKNQGAMSARDGAIKFCGMRMAAASAASRSATRACSRCSWHEYKPATLPVRGEPTSWHAAATVRQYREALRSGIDARGYAVIDNMITTSDALGVRGCW